MATETPPTVPEIQLDIVFPQHNRLNVRACPPSQPTSQPAQGLQSTVTYCPYQSNKQNAPRRPSLHDSGVVEL